MALSYSASGVTPGGPNLAMMYEFDQTFGTNTVESYFGMNLALDNYYNNLTSDDPFTSGTAFGEGLGAIFGGKGLGAMGKVARAAGVLNKATKVLKYANSAKVVKATQRLSQIAPLDEFIGGSATVSRDVSQPAKKIIGLGVDEDLFLHRGTPAVTYKNAAWQKMGLTKVDWGRAGMDDSYFKSSFKDAALNADGIRFNVTTFKTDMFNRKMTNFEFNHILGDKSLYNKTIFIDNGRRAFWNGTEFHY
jgi:hypothetical protein